MSKDISPEQAGKMAERIPVGPWSHEAMRDDWDPEIEDDILIIEGPDPHVNPCRLIGSAAVRTYDNPPQEQIDIADAICQLPVMVNQIKNMKIEYAFQQKSGDRFVTIAKFQSLDNAREFAKENSANVTTRVVSRSVSKWTVVE